MIYVPYQRQRASASNALLGGHVGRGAGRTTPTVASSSVSGGQACAPWRPARATRRRAADRTCPTHRRAPASARLRSRGLVRAGRAGKDAEGHGRAARRTGARHGMLGARAQAEDGPGRDCLRSASVRRGVRRAIMQQQAEDYARVIREANIKGEVPPTLLAGRRRGDRVS